jgi:hypothetical protein
MFSTPEKRKEAQRKFREKNPNYWKINRKPLTEEQKKEMRERYHRNRDRYMASNKRWMKENEEKYKESLKKARKRERENLTDNYIRQSLYISIYNQTGKTIKRKEIPQEMIEQYRQIQITKRRLKDENRKTT